MKSISMKNKLVLTLVLASSLGLISFLPIKEQDESLNDPVQGRSDAFHGSSSQETINCEDQHPSASSGQAEDHLSVLLDQIGIEEKTDSCLFIGCSGFF